MKDRHLPEDQGRAIALVKESVGRIIGIQKIIEGFFNSYRSNSKIFSALPPEVRQQMPDMAPAELKWQRFSDGIVLYIPLGGRLVNSPVNSVHALLLASGLSCMLGLAGSAPLRIGIDVAWGIEYRPNELYGAAIAHSYCLESKIAQWPRVVVGAGLTNYLRHYQQTADGGLSNQFRSVMAQKCLDLLAVDKDEHTILDYLGPEFRSVSPDTFNDIVISKAQIFVRAQIQHWQQQKNEKLLHRYEQVAAYISENTGKA